MKHDDPTNWNELTEIQKNDSCYNKKLSLEVITEHWNELTEYQKDCCCEYQKLSQAFIAKYWKVLTERQKYHCCQYQKLSQAFIIKNWNEFTEFQKNYCCQYQKLSLEFITKYWNEFTKWQKNDCQQIQLDYPNKEQRIIRAQEYAKQHELETDKISFIAFRNHDFHGRGMFNKTIFYEQGKTYRDWHCDPRENEKASFGLGIFPKGNTKVRVQFEDFVVAVNREDGKARVEAFEMIKESEDEI